MPTGTVKWFNPAKGYGFISPDDGGNDVFVHVSALERTGMTSTAEGVKVEYELERASDTVVATDDDAPLTAMELAQIDAIEAKAAEVIHSIEATTRYVNEVCDSVSRSLDG